MAFKGPYPTKFSGHTSAMVISATTFSGGVTNAGTIGAGGVTITSSTFLTGGFLNSNLISGAATGIRALADSTIQGAIVDSGTIRATNRGIVVSGAVVSGGIAVGTHGKISAASAILVENTPRFGGGITNSGNISAAKTGVNISGVTTVSGGIVNRGTITAMPATGDMGIFVTGVRVFGDSSAGGGVTNIGTISAADQAILLQSVATFTGAIVNSGRLVAETGIHYDSFSVFGAGTSGGGITNTGTIVASDRGINLDFGTVFTGVVANSSVIAAHGTGINIVNVKILSGGVSNSGKITATSGVGIQVSTSSGAVLGNTSASGSVVNSGTISAAKGIVVQSSTIAAAIINGGVIVAKGDFSAKSDGIVVRGVATFLGGVSNRGSISAGHIGIEFGKSTTNAFGVSSVVGSIVNSGTITAKTGIALYASTITSGIIDSGSIKATSHGILIERASEVLSSKTAINVAGPTFTGGIFNAGVVSGSAGILIKSAHAVSIFDGGVIVGTGGTAIEFAGSGNTLTLGAGYTIGGTVDPSGNNSFQLGGSGPIRSTSARSGRNTSASPPSAWLAAPGR